MKRLAIYLTVAILTFGLGVSVWLANPLRWIKSQPSEPLLITVSLVKNDLNSSVPSERYLVTVKNVSSRTIRGYSLGVTCECQSWDDDGNFYPHGIEFLIPVPEAQTLRPGESQTIPFSADGLGRPFRVWADLVHFKGGGNWGANQSRTRERYVRE
jgi:hypothetical protein